MHGDAAFSRASRQCLRGAGSRLPAHTIMRPCGNHGGRDPCRLAGNGGRGDRTHGIGDRPTGCNTRMMAWLGPAIGPAPFRGRRRGTPGLYQDVTRSRHPRSYRPCPQQRQMVRRSFSTGTTAVAESRREPNPWWGECTFSDPARFFSYRRDGNTGRMAGLIWLTD